VEPLVSEQWFVAVKTLAAEARAAVPDKTRIFPESWLKTYYAWLDNIRDWCISRQIWWGHRIPAWTCDNCAKLLVLEEAPDRCPDCGGSALTQEEDVLDTWFSSALWPFSTLGWPDKTPELARFYPTSVLVTGFDILFFWVARMLMLGIHFMDQAPFRHVYLHALVRDAQGRKMSKSTGNVIDPLLMIEKYGTDSLRFTLSAFAAMGRDIRLSEDRIEGYRHFMNKIWNAARFSLLNLESAPPAPVDFARLEGLHHRWILHRLEEIKAAQAAALPEYRFNDAAQALYSFVWSEFCDWYLECLKPDMRAGGARGEAARFVLWTVLRETLVLLHPIIPFISSEIWAALPGASPDLSAEKFPASRPECLDESQLAGMGLVQAVIVAVRTIRAELDIPPSLRLSALVRPRDEQARSILEEQREILMTLARLDSLSLDSSVPAPGFSASQVAQGNEVIIPLSGAIDPAAETARLDKELAKADKERALLESKLAKPAYRERAPREVVDKDLSRLKELLLAKEKLLERRRRFAGRAEA
jgi:valyl-tRNA synthetase